MEHIDAILYINIEHRTDRKEHILNEIHKLCKDDTKIHRIDACYMKEFGALGCCKSHIKAHDLILEHPEWKKVLVLEDDFTFNDNPNIEELFRKFLDNFKTWDIFLPSFNNNSYDFRSKKTHLKEYIRISGSRTASSYLIQTEYVWLLRENFKASEALLEKHGNQTDFCCDIYWKKLQKAGNWFAHNPPLGLQYRSYSDIEGRVVYYGV